MSSDVVICLPARYQSSRFPGKPLFEIAGKPLIIWALESAAKLDAKQMVVATDDTRIIKLVEKHGYNAVMTSKEHQSGTDRLAEVAQLMNWTDDTIVVNYQGDEPLTPKENIVQLVQALIENPSASIATLYQTITNFDDLTNQNNVKLVTDINDYALYFSRAVIPFFRDGYSEKKLDSSIQYKHHIGLYAYRAQFLKKFTQLDSTNIEKTESLEQLRAISYGFKIIAKKANQKMPHGIDTLEDAKKVEDLLEKVKL